MSAYIIVGLGVVTWMVCMPRIGTLATVLFFAGPMVGSTIWPIATGLFWKKANTIGAFWAMVLGTGTGLIVYFQLGWYTASLIGAAVSMIVTIVATLFSKKSFNWSDLKEVQ